MPAASLLCQGSRFHDSERQTGETATTGGCVLDVENWLSWCFKFRDPKGVVASSSRLSISYRLPNQP